MSFRHSTELFRLLNPKTLKSAQAYPCIPPLALTAMNTQSGRCTATRCIGGIDAANSFAGCAAHSGQRAVSAQVAKLRPHAAFGALAPEIGSTNARVDVLEAEVRALKLRAAWTQRDILSSQVEQATRAIVCRNFPDWLTNQDGQVTIKHALTHASLQIEGGPQLWDLDLLAGNSLAAQFYWALPLPA